MNDYLKPVYDEPAEPAVPQPQAHKEVAIIPYSESSSLSTGVPVERFLGEYVLDGRLQTSLEHQKFTGPGFVIELVGVSTGQMFVRIKSQQGSEVRAFSPHALLELAKSNATPQTYDSIRTVIDQVARKADVETGQTIGGEDFDMSAYFGDRAPSIFVAGPGKPPGILKKGVEESYGVAEVKEGERIRYYIVRVQTRRVANNATVAGGSVNVDNVNAREILFVGHQEIELGDLLDLFETQRKNQEAIKEAKREWLTSTTNEENIAVGLQLAIQVNMADSDRGKYYLEQQKQAQAGIKQLSSDYDPVAKTGEPEIRGFMIPSPFTGYDYGDRKAEEILVTQIATAAGVRGKYGLTDLYEKSRMANSPIPEVTGWEDTILEATKGFLVTRIDKNGLRIADQAHPGVFYDVQFTDRLVGRDSWTYDLDIKIRVLDQRFISDKLVDIKAQETQKRLQVAIEAGTVSLTQLGEVGITVSDEQISLLNDLSADSILIDGAEVAGMPLAKVPPYLVCTVDRSFFVTRIDKRVVVLDVDRSAQVTSLLKVLESGLSEDAQRIAQELLTIQPLLLIARQRMVERRKHQREVTDQAESHKVTIQDKDQAIATAEKERDSYQNEVAQLEMKQWAAEQITLSNLHLYDDEAELIAQSSSTERTRYLRESSLLRDPAAGSYSLGRDITNDITLNDPEISREHARITRSGSNLMIEDLQSTNGTSINATRLQSREPYVLEEGDRIFLGKNTILFYIEGEILTREDVRDLPAKKAVSETVFTPDQKAALRTRIRELKGSSDYQMMESLQDENATFRARLETIGQIIKEGISVFNLGRVVERIRQIATSKITD